MSAKCLPGVVVAVGCSLLLALSVGCASAPAAAPTAAPKAAAKFPAKPIIFVAPGTIGGGSDVQARLAADAIDKAKLTEEPMAVLNKGASGAEDAYSFVKGKKGDAHYLITTTVQFFTYPLTGQAAYTPADFTPIANLVYDPYIVVAKPDSKFNTLKDLIDAAKAAPGTITAGMGQLGTQDHMALLTLQQQAGIQLKPVSFTGGGDTHRNVLGGQVEIAIGNPSDFMASVEAGKIKALAFLSPERNPGPTLKDIKTAKEQGYDIQFEIWRGWFAPAGIGQTEVDWLTNMFDKVENAQSFKDNYIIKFGMRPGYMKGAEFGKYLDGEAARYKKLLTDGGVIK
jgi:putative tricarboxylic transport membrane protein